MGEALNPRSKGMYKAMKITELPEIMHSRILIISLAFYNINLQIRNLFVT